MFKNIRTIGQSEVSRKKTVKINVAKIDESYADTDPYFCPYQRKIDRILNDPNIFPKVIVFEKSRQIGASLQIAYQSVIECASDIRDVIYTSYNKDSAKQFIKDAKKWALLLNAGYEYFARSQAINENNCNVFELKFNNGRTITAIAGNATNLRAKPGNAIIIDEAAYRQEPIQDIITAAMATIIHGGWIFITSTHAGKDSPFNKLCLDIDAGKLPYIKVKVTFREAIADGLYKAICRNNKKEWTLESEFEWIKSVYEYYGVGASEELDVIPADYSGGDKVFNPTMFTKVNITDNYNLAYFRYYDLAASADNANAYFSASVLVALDPLTDKLIICDYEAEQLLPLAGDDQIEYTVKNSMPGTIHLIEIEPGSSGIKYVEYMKERLSGYNVTGYRPLLSKLARAKPVGNAIANKKILISDALYSVNEHGQEVCEFVNIVRKFDGTKQVLVNDLVDCLSGIYDYYRQNYSDVEKTYESIYA